MPKSYFNQSIDDVFQTLATSPRGLSSDAVRERTDTYGPNALPAPKAPSLLSIFLSQFTSPLILILILSAVIMYFLHGISDTIVISAVLVLNAVIGTFQEGKAQSTLASLRKLTETMTIVRRDNREVEVPSGAIVPGDIIVLREGDQVSADARLIEAHALRVNEAILTGETLPVRKTTETLVSAQAIADQTNMLFRGTTIATGSGVAVVTNTGIDTEIGSIARSIAHIDTDVPLKKKISRLSIQILSAIGIFSTFFFLLSLYRGISTVDALLSVITLTVSLVPEGLPVILTLVLAISVKRMSYKHALVKKLQAVEALGQATVIAVDKTGTITLNELCVEQISMREGKVYQVTGKGFQPDGEILHQGKTIPATDHQDLKLLLAILGNATDAHIMVTPEGLHQAIGDPTEAAFVVASKKFQHALPHLSRIEFEPFDYTVRYSSHIFLTDTGDYHQIRIGAPDALLPLCHFSAKEKIAMETQLADMQTRGQRVVAVIDSPSKRPPHSLTSLPLPLHPVFLAFVGMQDSIHPEAKEAVAKARNAGIHVCMITGDHADTAVSIARAVGIYRDGDMVLTGPEIEGMSIPSLAKKLKITIPCGLCPVPSISVFSRVTPEQKLKIIQALRQNGEVVAMTGDGVNDAGSLVAADLGIAMGRHGTEVAKEAADIVLLDDNFMSITAAIKEGRNLYIRIKTVIMYLLSTGVGEALTLSGALLLGFPSPLTPIQILWLNFVTDGFLNKIGRAHV